MNLNELLEKGKHLLSEDEKKVLSAINNLKDKDPETKAKFLKELGIAEEKFNALESKAKEKLKGIEGKINFDDIGLKAKESFGKIDDKFDGLEAKAKDKFQDLNNDLKTDLVEAEEKLEEAVDSIKGKFAGLFKKNK